MKTIQITSALSRKQTLLPLIAMKSTYTKQWHKLSIDKLVIVTLLLLPFYSYSQLKVNSIGNVGLGNSAPAYKLDVEGTTRFSNWTDILVNWSGLSAGPVIYPENDWYLQFGKATNRVGTMFVSTLHLNTLLWDSDAEIKKDIEAIKSPMSIVKSLNGKTYKFTDSYLEKIPEIGRQTIDQTQFGFIAEDLQKVLPNIVFTDSGTTHSRVNYIAIIPILVEALKEQQLVIDRLVSQSSLNKTDGVTGLGNDIATLQKSDAVLFQNTPNPYSEKTEIKFYIPSNFTSSFLLISNLNGEQMKKYSVTSKGSQSIVVDGGEFMAGSYYYTLIVDNKEVDTKKMILIK